MRDGAVLGTDNVMSEGLELNVKSDNLWLLQARIGIRIRWEFIGQNS